MAKITHIQAGFSKWYNKEIATLGWAATFAGPLVNLVVTNTLRKNEKTIKLMANDEGEIDIDALHKEYAEIINKAGSIELFGIRFNAQDLDKLYAAIKAEIPTK